MSRISRVVAPEVSPHVTQKPQGCEVQFMNQKRCFMLISLRHLLFMTILGNIRGVNEIMRFLHPKYRRNRLTAQRAGGSYNDQSN